jgi:phospholipid transport system substrate-binding protein
MWPRRVFLASVALTLAGVSLAPLSARAEDIGKAAAAFVQGLADQVIQILKNKSLSKDDRVARLADVFLDGFDVRAIGIFVLGRYGRGLANGVRQEYLDVFRNYVVHTYAVRFNSYAGEAFTVTKTTPDGEAGAWVFSNIGQPGEEPVEVQWRVRQVATGFRIIDVVVEGVSLVVTQRSEFASVLQHNNGNVPALTDLLRKKIGEFEKKL